MRKEQKLVFFDIDGTLLNEKMELPKRTKESIYQLKEDDVYVAIATGRAPFMFEDLRNELEIDTFVSVNGSYVVVEGEVIRNIPIDKDKLMKLETATKEATHAMVFLDDQGIIANQHDNFYIEKSLSELGLPYPPVSDRWYDERTIYQALIFCEEQEEAYLKEYDEFKYIRWHRYAVDILPDGGSKALGIKDVLDHLQIKRENTYAFGDGYNDVEMLQYVGMGVAMANGREITKSVADYVTKDVNEDGVYHGLKKIGLIN